MAFVLLKLMRVTEKKSPKKTKKIATNQDAHGTSDIN